MVRIPKFCWLIAAILLLSTVINYTARLTLSVVVGNVLHDFSMTEKDYAQIVSLFLVAYALMYAGSGYVVDRLDRIRTFRIHVVSRSSVKWVRAWKVVTGRWPVSFGACRTR
jgi:ACS family hexuronate transporter-like MFS transporter